MNNLGMMATPVILPYTYSLMPGLNDNSLEFLEKVARNILNTIGADNNEKLNEFYLDAMKLIFTKVNTVKEHMEYVKKIGEMHDKLPADFAEFLNIVDKASWSMYFSNAGHVVMHWIPVFTDVNLDYKHFSSSLDGIVTAMKSREITGKIRRVFINGEISKLTVEMIENSEENDELDDFNVWQYRLINDPVGDISPPTLSKTTGLCKTDGVFMGDLKLPPNCCDFNNENGEVKH